MTRLLQRRARLIIGSTVIETDGDSGLRVAFSVTRTTAREANDGVIRIYNLSEATRAAVQEVEGRIALEAGYADRSGAILVATKGEVTHAREGTDWVTTVEVEDGRAEFAQRPIGSFAPGTSADFVVRDLVRQASEASGVAVARRVSAAAQAKLTAAVFERGYSLTPDMSIAKALGDVARRARVRLSFQDGAVQILDATEATLDSAVLLSPETGLVGSPVPVTERQTKGGVTTKRYLVRGQSLLRSELAPNVRVSLESSVEKGTLRLTRVDHVGDSHASGDAWVTRWEGVRV